MKKILIVISAAVILFGCGKSTKSDAVFDLISSDDVKREESKTLAEGNFTADRISMQENQPIINKKIIKNGSVHIQSNNVQKSRSELEKVLSKTDAYVQNEIFDSYTYEERFNLTVRVPNQNFDALINSLYNNVIGIVRNKNVSSNDVTEDYYDTEIRLKNRELYLEKYRDFLSKAKKIEDMLKIQETIRNMEEEIESAKGKLRFIDDRVNFSTLDIQIYKEKPAISGASEVGFFGRLWASVVTGWNLLSGIFFGILSVWSVILIAAAIIWGIFKIRKNRKKRRSEKSKI